MTEQQEKFLDYVDSVGNLIFSLLKQLHTTLDTLTAMNPNVSL